MKTIANKVSYMLEIKKSEFICSLKNVNNVEEAKAYILKIKEKYSDASHNCSAYIVGQNKKVNDDGEPKGTAGMPILNVLEHHDLQNIVCIVTRYFGGVKLGAGGLIRAYSKTTSQALNSTNLINLIPGELIELTVPFSVNDSLNYYLTKNKIIITNKYYENNVKYFVKVKLKEKSLFKKEIELISYLIKSVKKEDILMEDNEK